MKAREVSYGIVYTTIITVVSGRYIKSGVTIFCIDSVCVCVCVFFLPIHSGHQVRWTYQPGSHRRKFTQDFSSFFLRCVP